MTDPQPTDDAKIQDLYRSGDGVGTIAEDLSLSVDDVWAALNRGPMDSYYSKDAGSHG